MASLWTKAPAALVDAFEAALPDDARVVRRHMFGYPCAFTTGGHMFTGLFRDQLFMRLSDADRDALLRLEGSRPFEPMAGRPMRGYFVVPAAVQTDETALRDWMRRALEHTAALPPKTKTKPKAKSGQPKRSAKPKAGAKPKGRRR